MRRLAQFLALLLLAALPLSAQEFVVLPPGTSFTGGTLTSPLLLPAGTAEAPSMAFTSDADGTGTGWYRSAANEISATINGTQRTKTYADGFLIAGTGASSGLYFDTTGYHIFTNLSGGGFMDFNVAGASALRLNGTTGNLQTGYGYALGATTTAAPDIFLSRISDGVLGLKSDGTSAAELRIDGDGTASDTKYAGFGHNGTYAYFSEGAGTTLGLFSTTGFALASNGATAQGLSASGSDAVLRGAIIYLQGMSGVAGNVQIAGAIQGGRSKTLTESSATIFAKYTMTSGSSFSGQIIYEIKANDATDFQTLGGTLSIQAIDKAGAITCQVAEMTSGVVPAVPTALTTSGTLTDAFTCADAGSNVLNILANSVSSLTQTTLTISHRLNSTDIGAYAGQ